MKKIKILLIGKNGQIGSAIKRRLNKINRNITCLSKKRIKFGKFIIYRKKIKQNKTRNNN